MQKAFQHFIRQFHLGKNLAHLDEFRDGLRAVLGTQPFFGSLSCLWRVETEPDFAHFRLPRPECSKFLQITWPCKLLARDRAMDNNSMADDVTQNPVVSGWSSPAVVLRLKSINRNTQVEVAQISPRNGNGTNGAGDQLHFQPHPVEDGKKHIQFPESNQGFATHNGKMHRSEATDDSQHSLDKSLAFQIAEFP